jgi:hypothetical protein
MKIINQYSFVIAAAALLLVAVAFVIRHKVRWQGLLALAVIAAGMVTAWIVLHPRQTPFVEDAKKVQAMIGQGTPVLLEFQSPY